MGLELHITRAAFYADNDSQQISADEWLAYIASDSELTLSPENGEHFVIWSGKSAYDRPWLDWFEGNVFTKWPDTALYQKMLQIARTLNAKVQDDDGTIYPDESDWDFDPRKYSPSAHHRAASQRQFKVQIFARCFAVVLLLFGALMQFSENKPGPGVLLSILCVLVAFSTWRRYKRKASGDDSETAP